MLSDPWVPMDRLGIQRGLGGSDNLHVEELGAEAVLSISAFGVVLVGHCVEPHVCPEATLR